MCNCGNKRTSPDKYPYSTDRVNPVQQEKMWPDISFIYTGRSALTVRGTVSGKQYRFSSPGDSQTVEYRNAAAMMNVPVLKRIK